MSKGYDYRADMLATHEPKPTAPKRTMAEIHAARVRKAMIVRELGLMGYWRAAIAQLCGTSKVMVYLLCRDFGLTVAPRPPIYSSPLCMAIREGYADKKPPTQIAKEQRTSSKTIMVLASRMGIAGGDTARFRRGFEIPDDKRADYRYLTQRKGLTAHQAGEVLGLVARPRDPRYSGQDQEARP